MKEYFIITIKNFVYCTSEEYPIILHSLWGTKFSMKRLEEKCSKESIKAIKVFGPDLFLNRKLLYIDKEGNILLSLKKICYFDYNKMQLIRIKK